MHLGQSKMEHFDLLNIFQKLKKKMFSDIFTFQSWHVFSMESKTKETQHALTTCE